MKTNYQSAIERINRCKMLGDCERLDRSIDRLWYAGAFTILELTRLDEKLVEKKILLENETQLSDEPA